MEHQFANHREEKNLLDDFNYVEEQIPTGKGERFGNYFIDNIICRIIITALNMVVTLPTIATFWDGDFANNYVIYGVSYYLVSLAVSSVPSVLYYTLLEGGNQGRTIGKLMTSTRAVRLDGKPLTYTDALLRSLCRLIPFEVVSGLGYAPWHDRLTKTTVVKK